MYRYKYVKTDMNAQHIQLNVPISFTQVVDIVRQLSTTEKRQLSEVLLHEQSLDNMTIPEEHKQIVQERIKKYENSPNRYLSWDDIERKTTAPKTNNIRLKKVRLYKKHDLFEPNKQFIV